MPVIAVVDGVKLQVFFDDHPPPHVHLEFAGRRAQMAIATSELLRGELPRAKLETVLIWMSVHRQSVMTAWDEAKARRTPGRIK